MSDDPTPDQANADVEAAIERELQIRGYVHGLTAITAAHAGGLFALTQLPRMGDWGITVASYAFAIGLPMSGMAAWDYADCTPAESTEQALLVTLVLLGLSGLITAVGFTSLFMHFHVGVALAFILSAAVAVAVAARVH